MESIAENLISGLNADAGLAFIELAARVDDLMRSDHIDSEDVYIIRVVITKFLHLKAASGELKISIPNYDKSDSTSFINHFVSMARSYRVERAADIAAKRVEDLLSIEESLRENRTFGIAQLSVHDKDSVRNHIQKARKIVSDSSLEERKRNAILERLIDAERELDTIGTRTDRFFTLMGDAAFVVGDMAEKAKPFTTELKEILKIVFRGRESTEGVRLPKGDDPLLLPPSEG